MPRMCSFTTKRTKRTLNILVLVENHTKGHLMWRPWPYTKLTLSTLANLHSLLLMLSLNETCLYLVAVLIKYTQPKQIWCFSRISTAAIRFKYQYFSYFWRKSCISLHYAWKYLLSMTEWRQMQTSIREIWSRRDGTSKLWGGPTCTFSGDSTMFSIYLFKGVNREMQVSYSHKCWKIRSVGELFGTYVFKYIQKL